MTERSASVKELLRTSEAGKYENIRRLLQNHEFSVESIDMAIRQCLNKFILNKNYEESIKLLFSYGNVNYINSNENNSNIFMKLCSKANKIIINKLLDGKYLTKNKNIIEIDLYKVDNNKYNILHYLIKSQKNQEIEAIPVFEKIMNYNNNINQNKNKGNKNNDKIELLSQPDNKGITPLILILQRGWTAFLYKYLEYVDYKKYIVPLTNNNLIHYAIEGKKINCVKKILSYSTSEDLKYNNKDGCSPSLYAKLKNYNYMSKLIEETENNYNNSKLKNIIISPYISLNQVVEDFMKKKFDYILYYLTQFKILYFINEPNINYAFEWNKFITGYYNKIYFNDEKQYYKEKINLVNCINEFAKFFNKNIYGSKLKNKNDELLYNFDILSYNKIIFYMKINDWESLLKNINTYFNFINFQNKKNNNFLKKIIFINITFILIEYFISINNEKMSSYLIESLETFLKQNNNNENDINSNFMKELIIQYLNKQEVFHLFNQNYDDIHIYICLLNSLLNIKNKIIKEYYKDNLRDLNNIDVNFYFKDFKQKIKKYKNDTILPSLNKIKIIYTVMKSKIYFMLNNSTKSLNKILLVKKSKFENYSIEYKLYYYNSMGILNLYLKNYNLSEYYLKIGIKIFEIVSKNCKNILKKCLNNDDTILNRLNYLYKLKYNYGLSLFYQNKYKEAYDIFENIIKISMFQNNIFLLYRFGLCALQLYILSLKNNNKEKSSIFKVQEKSKKKQSYDKSEIDKRNSHNSSNYSFNLNSNDDLFNQFEEEYGKNKENENRELKKNFKIFLINRNNNKTFFNLNLIYLQQSIKIFKKIIKIFKFKNMFKELNEEETNIIKDQNIKNLYSYYKKNIHNNNEKNKINDSINKSNFPKNIFFSTFLNLLFAYSLQKKWLDILLEIKWFKNIIYKEFPSNNNNNIHYDILKKINYYKLLSLINLNNINKTKNFIDTELNHNNYKNDSIDCFNIVNGNIEKNINHYSYISCAEILMDCKQRKYLDAENKAKKLMLEYFNKYKKFSVYYYELYIYTLLIQNKKEIALSLIKYKNINNFK